MNNVDDLIHDSVSSDIAGFRNRQIEKKAKRDDHPTPIFIQTDIVGLCESFPS